MILLIGIIAVIGLCMYSGHKQGMIKIVLSFLALAITLILVTFATPIVCKAVKQTDQFKDILEKTESKMEKQGIFKAGSLEDMVNKLDVPEQFKETIIKSNTAEKYEELCVKNANEYIVNMVASFVLTGVVFAILFVVIYILVRVVINVLDIISRLPLLKQVNKSGGAAIGALEGIIIVWVFFIIVNVFGNTEFATFIYDQINDNAIVTFIYDNNLVMKILLKLMP